MLREKESERAIDYVGRHEGILTLAIERLIRILSIHIQLHDMFGHQKIADTGHQIDHRCTHLCGIRDCRCTFDIAIAQRYGRNTSKERERWREKERLLSGKRAPHPNPISPRQDIDNTSECNTVAQSIALEMGTHTHSFANVDVILSFVFRISILVFLLSKHCSDVFADETTFVYVTTQNTQHTRTRTRMIMYEIRTYTTELYIAPHTHTHTLTN